MDAGFEIIEHTADVRIRAFGETQSEAYANSAKGMFSLIVEPDTVRSILSREIEVEAPDRECLLVAWLNELIYFFDTEQILFRRFDIHSVSNTHLQATCYGEKTDPSRHEIKIGIKSATYHMLKVEAAPRWRAEILLDI